MRHMSLNIRSSAENDSGIKDDMKAASSIKPFYDARILYSIAPAMGHNKVIYSWVPSIISCFMLILVREGYSTFIYYHWK